MKRRRPVQTLDEIPEFTSEDEEREWWATHDLSEELYERLRPAFDDLEDLLPLQLRAREAPQVELSLVIARKHLTYLKRGRTRPVRLSTNARRDDTRLHHALISIVFTAAAVEAGLNLYISAPALLLPEEHQRLFFAQLSMRCARMSIPEKLGFVKAMCPALVDNGLLHDMRELFECRNTIAHAMPVYVESASGPQGMRKEASERRGSRKDQAAATRRSPSLMFGVDVSSEDIERAFVYYARAEEFLGRLRLASSEKGD